MNARTAAAAMAALGLKQEFIERGIHAAQWPGRLELVSHSPDVYLDGAHNVAGARAVGEFIREKYPNRKLWLVFGVMRDKNIRAITEALFPLASELILTAPAIERAMPPQEIPAPGRAQIAATVAEALGIVKRAASEDVVLITGSLFLVGEARALLLA
jgi:dihydrofolate synthase/folylpolyglutamate synthase